MCPQPCQVWHPQTIPWHHRVLPCPSELESFSLHARHPEHLSFCPPSFLGMFPLCCKCQLTICYLVDGLSIRLPLLLYSLALTPNTGNVLVFLKSSVILVVCLCAWGGRGGDESKTAFLKTAKSWNSSPDLLWIKLNNITLPFVLLNSLCFYLLSVLPACLVVFHRREIITYPAVGPTPPCTQYMFNKYWLTFTHFLLSLVFFAVYHSPTNSLSSGSLILSVPFFFF